MRNQSIALRLLFTSLIFVACSKKDSLTASSVEDSSTSGTAAGVVGGAIAGSDSNGTISFYELPKSPLFSLVIHRAQASGACPTLMTANGSGCTNSGNAVDVTLSSCSYGSSAATWTGVLEVTLSSGAAVSCGTFPSNPGNSVSIQRQFVSSSGVPGTATRTSARGTNVVIDHETANLANFDNQIIAANIGSGYGTKVTFNGSGARTGVSVKQRVYTTGGFDHSVVGSITLSESGTTRTASGSLTVYHNKLKVVATSTFNNVVYNDTKCIPVSGNITTSFAAGANVSPTLVGSALVGKSETLTFNGDGTGTLVDATGDSTTVELTHCY